MKMRKGIQRFEGQIPQKFRNLVSTEHRVRR